MYVLTLINFKSKKSTRFYFIKKYIFKKSYNKYKIVDDFNNEIFDIKLKSFLYKKLKNHKHNILNNKLLISVNNNINNINDRDTYTLFISSNFNFL